MKRDFDGPVSKAWTESAAALASSHEFWRQRDACMSGGRADHPGDLYADLVELGEGVECLRDMRELLLDVARSSGVAHYDAERAAETCERYRHLMGRLMADVVFRAAVQASGARFEVSTLSDSTRALVDEWAARSPSLNPRRPFRTTNEQSDEAESDQAARSTQLERYFVREIEKAFESGREGRTAIEVLLNEHPNHRALVPFAVLCEAAAEGEMEWNNFARAVRRQVEKLREATER